MTLSVARFSAAVNDPITRDLSEHLSNKVGDAMRQVLVLTNAEPEQKLAIAMAGMACALGVTTAAYAIAAGISKDGVEPLDFGEVVIRLMREIRAGRTTN